ncbi:Gfo/Idh/MocA family protein [Phycisphaerales bacterium AB-hyl4]|uniref:Gfo/Idh/MocA family protein n=1 Tax=Natronomicrosphaera hydrolytica TaxID=3242702 RepID=A0ABV4U2U4_9BACT
MIDEQAAGGKAIGYGLIGAGSFGQFACTKYQELDAVRPIALADENREAADRAAASLGIEASESVDALLARDDIDLVHIATPPFTHRELVTRALEAGKHVLCEKPLATSLADAEMMIDLAESKGRILSVNLIMRYDPLCETMKRIIESKLLGEPVHGFFENYAKDEPLPPEHWFWKQNLSGGIFIEHGVHFFDLFQWWLGEPEIVAAQQIKRGGADLIEQVQATARYGEGVLVNFYHGFTQATRMDRQEMRLVFERGAISLDEWVPTSMTIDCIATRDQVDAMAAMLPDCQIENVASYTGEDRKVTSRHKSYEVDGHYRLYGTTGMTKDELYGHVLQQLLLDQIQAINDSSHQRRVSERNGYGSLHAAVTAEQLSRHAVPMSSER